MQMWLCVGVSHTLRAAASLTVDVRSQQLSSQQAMRKSLVSSWQMCSKKKHTRMFSQRTEQAWSPDSPCCDNKDMTHDTRAVTASRSLCLTGVTDLSLSACWQLWLTDGAVPSLWCWKFAAVPYGSMWHRIREGRTGDVTDKFILQMLRLQPWQGYFLSHQLALVRLCECAAWDWGSGGDMVALRAGSQ